MLKKALSVLVLSSIFMIIFNVTCFANIQTYDYFKQVKLIIGEKNIEVNYQPSTIDQPAYLKNGRSFVPLGFVGRALGSQVVWDAKKNQATITLHDIELIVPVGSTSAYVNKKVTKLDVPAEIKGGRIFVPLRFVSENLGAIVFFDDSDQSIYIRYADLSNWQEVNTPWNFKLKAPGNWTPEVINQSDNKEIIFTSPLESKLDIYFIQGKPAENYQLLKDKVTKDGYKIFYDELDTPGNVNDGFEVRYKQHDPTTKKDIIICTFIKPVTDEVSYEFDLVIAGDDDTYDMDAVIGTAIGLSY